MASVTRRRRRNRILRGEIRWAALESVYEVEGREMGNSRPVVILSRDSFNAESGLVLAALITSGDSKRHQMPVPITSVPMHAPSWVLTDQIRSLSVKRIGDSFGVMSDDELDKILERIRKVVGL